MLQMGRIWMLAVILRVALHAAGVAEEKFETERKEIKRLEELLAKSPEEKKGRARDLLGQTIADLAVTLNSEARAETAAGGRQRAAGERASRFRLERDQLRERLDELWQEGVSFATFPATLAWQPQVKERVAYLEYVDAEEVDPEELQKQLHLKRIEWRHVAIAGRRSQGLCMDPRRRRYSLHLGEDREVAIFFYLRAKEERKAEIRVKLMSRNDSIRAVYLNNQEVATDEGTSCRKRVRLREGANLVVCYMRNGKGPEFEFEVRVDDRKVAHGCREPSP